jgi:gentisate 1,2-dioxygenase
MIDGHRTTWKQGDTFCIPSWQIYQHTAAAEELVYLYRFDDQPMLKSLGFYRKDNADSNSLVSN